MPYVNHATVGGALQDALDRLAKAQVETKALADQAYKARCLLDTLKMTVDDRNLLREQLSLLSKQASHVISLFYYQP